METYLTPGAVLVVIALLVIGLRAAADLRAILTVPARKEHITREEYDKDEKTRREQHRDIRVKCRNNARGRRSDRTRSEAKFEVLVQALAELKIQLARLATCMEEREVRRTAAEVLDPLKEPS